MSSVWINNVLRMTGFHCGTVLLNGSRALRIGRWYSQYQPITKPCWGGLQNAATSQPPLQSKPPSLFAWIITTFAPPQSIPTTAARLILSWNLNQMTLLCYAKPPMIPHCTQVKAEVLVRPSPAPFGPLLLLSAPLLLTLLVHSIPATLAPCSS